MRRGQTVLAVLCSTLWSLLLCVVPCARADLIVLPPSIDPFYRPPLGFASSAPGTILRQRQINPAALTLLTRPLQGTQLLYTTRSINGTTVATVTTILRPADAEPGRFVSFQAAEDSAWVDCAPSYNIQVGSVPINAISGFENLLIQVWLGAGFVVAVPDHEGPDAAFAAGRLEGYATLDGMRAAKAYLQGEQAIFGAGYSGGAIATGWAASLQPTYAAELDVRGWSMGGTPVNLTGTLVYVDGTVFAGFLPAAIAGLNTPSSYQAVLDPLLRQIVTPYGWLKLGVAKVNCAVADILSFAGQSILSSSFQRLGPGLLEKSVIIEILRQNIMGLNPIEMPTAPVLLYHADFDEIIPYSNASALNDAWCRQGASVDFRTYAAGGHATTEILGLPAAIAYARAAFAGSVPSGCSAMVVDDAGLDTQALGLDAEPALVALLNELVRLDPTDEELYQRLASQ